MSTPATTTSVPAQPSSAKPETAAAAGTVVCFSPAQHTHLIPYLAALHASCITNDGTMFTFLPPLSREKLLSWWKDRIAEAGRGERAIFLLLDGWTAGTRPKGPDLVGIVMLAPDMSETGAFRASVDTLLIATRFRGRGGARCLVDALEAEAVRRGKTLLMLEVQTGSPAEDVFSALNYDILGIVPRYAIAPEGVKDCSFYYKHLNAGPPLQKTLE